MVPTTRFREHKNISTVPGVKLLMEAAEVKPQQGACVSSAFYPLPSGREISQASGQPSGSPAQGDGLLLSSARLCLIQCSELPPVHTWEDFVPEMILQLANTHWTRPAAWVILFKTTLWSRYFHVWITGEKGTWVSLSPSLINFTIGNSTPAQTRGPQATLLPFHGTVLAGNLGRIMSESITKAAGWKSSGESRIHLEVLEKVTWMLYPTEHQLQHGDVTPI